MIIPEYTTAEITKIEERMRPGQMSTGGFLTLTESLLDVYNADVAVIGRNGISYEQIGKCLWNYIIRASQMKSDFPISKLKDVSKDTKGYGLSGKNLRAFDKGTKINDEIVVFSCGWHGSQFCPFPCPVGDDKPSEHSWTKHCPHGGSREYLVYNLSQKDYIVFSELHEHLIKDHHFFEGHTSFRVEPEQLIRVLNISATKNYDLQSVMKSSWSWTSSSSGSFVHEQEEKNLVWKLLDEEYQVFVGVTNEEKDEMKFKILNSHHKTHRGGVKVEEKTYRIGEDDFKINLWSDRVGYTRIYYKEYLLE